jgi:hypothetical protein
MLRTITKIKKINISNVKCLARFSTSQPNLSLDIFPDQIVSNLKAKIGKATDEDLKEIETDIVNKIHFFDSDQYADIVILLARANKGTDLLWDVLSRKVYDYELDYMQSDALLTALNHTYKCDDFLIDALKKNLYRFYANRTDKNSKLYRNFYF